MPHGMRSLAVAGYWFRTPLKQTSLRYLSATVLGASPLLVNEADTLSSSALNQRLSVALKRKSVLTYISNETKPTPPSASVHHSIWRSGQSARGNRSELLTKRFLEVTCSNQVAVVCGVHAHLNFSTCEPKVLPFSNLGGRTT